jgi:hypothetical protein
MIKGFTSGRSHYWRNRDMLEKVIQMNQVYATRFFLDRNCVPSRPERLWRHQDLNNKAFLGLVDDVGHLFSPDLPDLNNVLIEQRNTRAQSPLEIAVHARMDKIFFPQLEGRGANLDLKIDKFPTSIYVSHRLARYTTPLHLTAASSPKDCFLALVDLGASIPRAIRVSPNLLEDAVAFHHDTNGGRELIDLILKYDRRPRVRRDESPRRA